MERKLICFIIGLIGSCGLFSCIESDVEDEGNCHAYFTLVNQSDYSVRLKYYERGPNTLKKSLYDTIIRRDSSYTMEVVWDILGSPFQRVDTLFVKYGDDLEFYDYSENLNFDMVLFSKYSNYKKIEESEYIRRATYTITNADYEYSKQKLADREAGKEGNEGERVNGYSREGRR